MNSTTITATIASLASSPLGAMHVMVITANGASNTVTFTVTPPAPKVSSITPNTGLRGTNVLVTIAGANLTGATMVTAGGGISVTTGITVNPAGTQLTATFTIGTAYQLTTRNVRVTTSGGTTPVNPGVTFTVVQPTLTSINPK